MFWRSNSVAFPTTSGGSGLPAGCGGGGSVGGGGGCPPAGGDRGEYPALAASAASSTISGGDGPLCRKSRRLLSSLILSCRRISSRSVVSSLDLLGTWGEKGETRGEEKGQGE